MKRLLYIILAIIIILFVIGIYFFTITEELILDKRMPIGSGLGSSASSSVDSVVAVNALLNNPFPRNHRKMLEAVVHGEAVATKGLGHADNVFPALFGGFVFIEDLNNYHYRRFLGGERMYFVVASPNLRSDTGEMRRALQSAPYDIPGLVKLTSDFLKRYLEGDLMDTDLIDLSKFVKNGGKIENVIDYLKGALSLIIGIRNQSATVLGNAMMTDKIVTPVRARYIIGYDNVKDAALSAGATGFIISGSGPAVVSSAYSQRDAEIIGDAKRRAFERNGVESKIYVAKVDNVGARLI